MGLSALSLAPRKTFRYQVCCLIVRGFDEAVIEPGKPVKTDNDSFLDQTSAMKDEPCYVEHIHPSSRSHTLKQRQYNSLYGKYRSPVSLAENDASDAAPSHQPHQETAQGYSSHYDRKLDPIIEMNSESEWASGMMTRKTVLLPRFGSDLSNTMIVDRTSPPASLYRAEYSSNMVDRDLRSRSGVTRKTVPAFLAPSRDDGKNESVLRTQKKNVSTGTLAVLSSAGHSVHQ